MIGAKTKITVTIEHYETVDKAWAMLLTAG
jgi:hypothetical protein